MNACKESFLGFVFSHFCLSCKCSPFTLSHFNDSEAFFSYIAASQFFELSFRTTTFDSFLNERRSNLLTGTNVIKAVHGFKRSIAKRTKKSLPKQSFFPLCPLYKNSRFCNLVLFVENRAWPYFQSYWSCFVEVYICLSVDRDPSAYKDRRAWVYTSNMDIVD